MPEGADPLASGRVTLLGLLRQIDDDDERGIARARYLEANPAASYYIDFGDFTFLQLSVEHVRYVGGYGRMSWVDATDYRTATPDPLVDAAAGIIEHMNADHADAQVLFCRHFAGLEDTRSATMSAVDRYGFDLVAVSDAHRTAVRLAFPDECTIRRSGAARDGRDGRGGTRGIDLRAGRPAARTPQSTTWSRCSPDRLRAWPSPRS